MINKENNQREIAWLRERMGNFTGSKISDLMKAGRKKDQMFGDTAMTYIYQVAAERQFNPAFLGDDEIFGDYIAQTQITSRAMQWGIDQEDAAIRTFLSTYYPDDNAVLDRVSLCKHDTIPYYAASPDGLLLDRNVGKQMVIEVKCPALATYMRYRAEIHDAESLKAVKPEYYWQMQAEMDCTGIDEGRFIVYCPWLSSPLHVAAIARNEEDIKAMQERVIAANKLIELMQ